MRNAAALVISAVFVFTSSLFSLQAKPAANKDTTVSVDSLLEQVSVMLPSLRPADRAYVLAHMVNSLGQKRPKQARQWTDEVFRISPQIPNKRERATYQILALGTFAGIDSQEALNKLASIEPPPPGNEYDPRAGAAYSVFPAYMKDHPGDLVRIAAVARKFGDTGKYPAGAISNLLLELHTSTVSHDDIEGLTQEALQYLEKASSSPANNDDFAGFLDTSFRFIAPELRRPALEKLVARLLSPEPAAQQKLVTLIYGAADTPYTLIKNHNELVLARIMPLIRSVDPQWEEKLMQEHPSIKNIRTALNPTGGGSISIGAYAYSAASEDQTIEKLWKDQAEMLAQRNPEQGLKALQNISNPSVHAEAGAVMAASVNASQPETANQLLEHAAKTLNTTTSAEEQFHIACALARSLVALNRREQAASMIDKAFSLGEELLRDSISRYPKMPFSDRLEYSGLHVLVQLSAKSMPQLLLQKINDVRIPELQAHLLVTLAYGLEAER